MGRAAGRPGVFKVATDIRLILLSGLRWLFGLAVRFSGREGPEFAFEAPGHDGRVGPRKTESRIGGVAAEPGVDLGRPSRAAKEEPHVAVRFLNSAEHLANPAAAINGHMFLEPGEVDRLLVFRSVIHY